MLAADVRSQLDVPPHDNSSMDGYALRAADVPAPGTVLPVSQRIAGRQSSARRSQPGTAARIFTGAQVPAGADAVVMQEQCERRSTAACASTRRCRSRPVDPPPRRGRRARRASCSPPARA